MASRVQKSYQVKASSPNFAKADEKYIHPESMEDLGLGEDVNV